MEKFYKQKDSVQIFFRQFNLSFGGTVGLKKLIAKGSNSILVLDKNSMLLPLFFKASFASIQTFGSGLSVVDEIKVPSFARGNENDSDLYQNQN